MNAIVCLLRGHCWVPARTVGDVWWSQAFHHAPNGQGCTRCGRFKAQS